jgi:hypothetical protein
MVVQHFLEGYVVIGKDFVHSLEGNQLGGIFSLSGQGLEQAGTVTLANYQGDEQPTSNNQS